MRKIFLKQNDFFAHRGACLAISKELRQCPMPPHQHEFLELVIIFGGEGIHNFNGQRYRIKRGHAFYIDENSTHGYEEPFRLNLVNIMINREALQRMERDLMQLPGYFAFFKDPKAPAYPGLCLDEEELEQASTWINHIEKEIAKLEGAAGYILAEAFLVLLISLILKRFQKAAPNNPAADSFKNTINWIDTHLDRPIPIPLLAGRSGYSERSFYRIFKEKTGLSPVRYIREARLRKAASLIRRYHKSLRCEDVARRCGFNDPGYFSTCFSRAYGVSPKAFRNGSANGSSRVPDQAV